MKFLLQLREGIKDDIFLVILVQKVARVTCHYFILIYNIMNSAVLKKSLCLSKLSGTFSFVGL